MTTYEHTLKLRLSNNSLPDNKANQAEASNICSVFKINNTKINKSPVKELKSPRKDTYRLNSINELKNKTMFMASSSVLQEKNLNHISTGLPCLNYNSNNNNNRYLKVDYENNDLTSNDASKLSSYRSENQDSLIVKLPPLMPLQASRSKIVKLPINFDDDENNNNNRKNSIDNDSYSSRGIRSNSSRSETQKKN